MRTRPRADPLAVTARAPRGGGEVEPPPRPTTAGDQIVPAPSREARAPVRAALLGDALSPDWETLEHDLQQYLARIEGLAAGSSGHGKGWEWLARFVVLTALVAAHEAARRRGRRPRWPAVEVGLAGAAPGPWPLGPP